LKAGRLGRQGRGSRQERQAATRAALLRSAARLVCKRGMQGASVELIAAEAGYTKGALYANFSSKEDLFLAMLDERFAAELERLESSMTGRREPAEEARQAAEDFLAYVDSDPLWPRLYQEFAAYAARNRAFREEFAARQRTLRASMANVFARWACAFDVEPPIPPSDVAAMTFFMADGFLLDRVLDPQLDDRLYGTMVEVFLRGLLQMACERQLTPTGGQPQPDLAGSATSAHVD
jgi:AcrR family transcriptional regulator